MTRFRLVEALTFGEVSVSVVERTATSGTAVGAGILLHGQKEPHAVLVHGPTGRFAIRIDGSRASHREIADECGLDGLSEPDW